jgi:hypothetical protein
VVGATPTGHGRPHLTFLQGKTREVFAKLDELRHLPYQAALLLLKQCIQQDVRHLQRSLRTDDLPGCWKDLDDRLAKEVSRLTADSLPFFSTGRALSNLPARYGGHGTLSHEECASAARAASTQEAAYSWKASWAACLLKKSMSPNLPMR